MPESKTPARPVKETPEREVASKAPAQRAERSARDAEKTLAEKRAAAEPEFEEKLLADLKALWPEA